MSVKRRDLIRYLEKNDFYLLREGGKHSIYTNDKKVVPVKRHRQLDRITPTNSANRPAWIRNINPKFSKTYLIWFPQPYNVSVSSGPNECLFCWAFTKNRYLHAVCSTHWLGRFKMQKVFVILQ
jgi:mRNA interferase HicA